MFTAFTSRNTTKATMRKLMQALMNAPKSMSVPGTTRPEMVSAPPPAITEMSGLMMFVVSAVTMDVTGPPMITATA